MPYSSSQMKAANKYIKKNYERINLTLKSGQKEIWKEAAAKEGLSLNDFIRIAVEEHISHHHS